MGSGWKIPEPAGVRASRVAILNQRLAAELGLNLGAMTLGFCSLASRFRPFARAYAGHRYGGFDVMEDGRAILLVPDAGRPNCQHPTKWGGRGFLAVAMIEPHCLLPAGKLDALSVIHRL